MVDRATLQGDSRGERENGRGRYSWESASPELDDVEDASVQLREVAGQCSLSVHQEA